MFVVDAVAIRSIALSDSGGSLVVEKKGIFDNLGDGGKAESSTAGGAAVMVVWVVTRLSEFFLIGEELHTEVLETCETLLFVGIVAPIILAPLNISLGLLLIICR